MLTKTFGAQLLFLFFTLTNVLQLRPPNTADLGTDEKAAVFSGIGIWEGRTLKLPFDRFLKRARLCTVKIKT